MPGQGDCDSHGDEKQTSFPFAQYETKGDTVKTNQKGIWLIAGWEKKVVKKHNGEDRKERQR